MACLVSTFHFDGAEKRGDIYVRGKSTEKTVDYFYGRVNAPTVIPKTSYRN